MRTMDTRQHVRFLRTQAAALRELAQRAPGIAEALRRLADQLDANADALERDAGPSTR
jgi:hypothetical protein